MNVSIFEIFPCPSYGHPNCTFDTTFEMSNVTFYMCSVTKSQKMAWCHRHSIMFYRIYQSYFENAFS